MIRPNRQRNVLLLWHSPRLHKCKPAKWLISHPAGLDLAAHSRAVSFLAVGITASHSHRAPQSAQSVPRGQRL